MLELFTDYVMCSIFKSSGFQNFISGVERHICDLTKRSNKDM